MEGIFAPEGESWVRIGRLVWADAEFRVNVDALTRHLAILAVTGGGKSNTVCVLVRRLVEDLEGTVVIFDVHGEYGSGIVRDRQARLRPKINPVAMTIEELFQLAQIPENATVQRRILREAWEEVIGLYWSGKLRADEVMGSLLEYLEGKYRELVERKNKSEAMKHLSVAEKIKDLERVYGGIIDGKAPLSLTDYIRPGYLNVVDLSSVDDSAADAVTSHLLRRILWERKTFVREGKGYPVPIITVIEEAHVLVPRDGKTLTKYWAGRIAREGRKFHVGMVLVSQRPKNVDDNVLSQTNNKIILRIVEPNDLSYVQSTTEQMSEDLKELLPGLSPGEAVIVGMMTRLPAIVKIDLCEGKKVGGDISLVKLWRRYMDNDMEDEDTLF